jgi:hypothetical protein
MALSQMTYSSLLNNLAYGLSGSSFLDIKTKLENNYYDGYAIAPFSGKKVLENCESNQYIYSYSKRLGIKLRFDKTQLVDLPQNPILMHNLVIWIEDSIIAGIRMPYPKIFNKSFIHIQNQKDYDDKYDDEDDDDDDDDDDDLDGFIVSDDFVEYEDDEDKPRKKIKI